MKSQPRRSRLSSDLELLRSLLLADCYAHDVRPGDPKLLMLAGLPGAGKSSFASRVTSLVPFLVLESDRIRKMLVGEPVYTPDEHSRVFRACHQLIHEFLATGYPVLFDATNLTERNRRPLYAIARKLGVPLAIAAVTAPDDVIRERLRDREVGLDPETWSDAGWAVYERMATAWALPKRPHFLVDTSRDTTPALQQVIEWARS